MLSLPAGFEWRVHGVPEGSSRGIEETKEYTRDFDQGTGLENLVATNREVYYSITKLPLSYFEEGDGGKMQS